MSGFQLTVFCLKNISAYTVTSDRYCMGEIYNPTPDHTFKFSFLEFHHCIYIRLHSKTSLRAERKQRLHSHRLSTVLAFIYECLWIRFTQTTTESGKYYLLQVMRTYLLEMADQHATSEHSFHICKNHFWIRLLFHSGTKIFAVLLGQQKNTNWPMSFGMSWLAGCFSCWYSR